MERTDIAIVGGGPVGLFLACRLAQLGLEVMVLEREAGIRRHSRSIGIHPPALERLEHLGVVDEILQRGVCIRRGLAFGRRGCLGKLEFSNCPPPYTFIMTLPQDQTEAILAARLCQLHPTALHREAEFKAFQACAEGVTVSYRQWGRLRRLEARFLVGCDGRHSRVRDLAGIAFQGGSYPDTYLMGDFADSTALGPDAAIYLTSEGLVESFPLPNHSRRWVAKTGGPAEATAETLAALLWKRLGCHLPLETNTMLSAFGVERYLASSLVKGRVMLAGDAAHVVSPIGGQGMNLGWLDAWLLAGMLAAIIKGQPPELLHAYQQRRRAAKRAIRRAEFNMRMGRKTALAPLRDVGLSLLLHSPAKRMLAHSFTMRGL